MILNNKTLEKLRDLINEETEYRSGSKLVSFFNQFGFNDQYSRGFPSRWIYTDEKLSILNGTPELDKCIKTLFNPVNYIGRYTELDSFISDFNQYLAFDDWQIVRINKEITFRKAGEINIDKKKEEEISPTDEQSFLLKKYDLDLNKLNFQPSLIPIMESRIEEIKKSMANNIPLASIFLSGSTLEGILLGMASNNPKQFNQANSSPRNNGKVKMLSEWSLNNLIDVSFELGYIKEDVKKFSHVLRDFRNYIHPFEQMSRNFIPDIHTAEICFQVLKAAIYQIGIHLSSANYSSQQSK